MLFKNFFPFAAAWKKKSGEKKYSIGVAGKVINYFLPGIYRFYPLSLPQKGQLSIYRYNSMNPFSLKFRIMENSHFQRDVVFIIKLIITLSRGMIERSLAVWYQNFREPFDWFEWCNAVLKKMERRSSDKIWKRFNSFCEEDNVSDEGEMGIKYWFDCGVLKFHFGFKIYLRTFERRCKSTLLQYFINVEICVFHLFL